MSVLGKIWKIKNSDPHTPLLQKLLFNRGLQREDEIERFFYPDAARDFHDPFLMRDMARAVERIGKSIEKSERIMIFGDYDVDGITGCAILMRCLQKLGANVSYRLPHRIEDGYGLREKFVREFKRLDVKLIITVDNGISCFCEVEIANTLGIDVIITDHHTIPEKIPNAFAILHPKLPNVGYPFTELTGAGVALKLAQALFLTRMKNPEEEIRKLLDLACMGTISDLGEMRGENRYIVKEGLKVLENTRWPGLSRLKESAGVRGKIDTHDIGFLLGPRINAAGRISHPSHALRLLLHDTEHTALLAQTLEGLNRKRQKMVEQLLEIAEEMAAEQNCAPLIIIAHPDFHGGVLGLLAAKLSEKYFRPAIVMEDRGEILVGSCRSIPGVNIVDALNTVQDLLTHFGGHSAAAGFDLPKERFSIFQKRLHSHISKMLIIEHCQPVLTIECKIAHDEVSQKTIEMLHLFEPFGMGNEIPRFLLTGVLILECRTVGTDKKHLKILAKLNGNIVDGIGFRLGQFAEKLKKTQPIDMVCEIEEDTWHGNKKIQLNIIDIRSSQ